MKVKDVQYIYSPETQMQLDYIDSLMNELHSTTKEQLDCLNRGCIINEYAIQLLVESYISKLSDLGRMKADILAKAVPAIVIELED